MSTMPPTDDVLLLAADRPAPPPTAAITVVIADDSDRFRDGMVRALARHPRTHVLAAVRDGREALAAARELRPDVLVVDQRMPGLTGLQVAARVAEHDPQRAVRVVLLTASDDEQLLEDARSAGAVAVVDKGWSRREICEAIARHGP